MYEGKYFSMQTLSYYKVYLGVGTDWGLVCGAASLNIY